MKHSLNPLAERLAEIGGQLQKLRWEALDAGETILATDIAHAIEAVAWAAGIYASGANVVEPPGRQNSSKPVAQDTGSAQNGKKLTDAA